MVEFLVMTGIFLAMAIPAYLMFGEQSENQFDGPHSLSSLASLMKLTGDGDWEVTIERRSGYVHDAWKFTGSANGALQTALQKLRQARVEEVAITCNDERRFRVKAYFDSPGLRRTGKYVGGFVVNRA
jgi:hypothetical protein